MRRRRPGVGSFGLRCSRCGGPLSWARVRLVGPRPFCSEACALIHLTERAAEASWRQATLAASRPGADSWLLGLARARAICAQRQLDRRLSAPARAGSLPWVWMPSRPFALAAVLVLVVWGAAGGYGIERSARGPIAPIVRAARAPQDVALVPAPVASVSPPGATSSGSRRPVGAGDLGRGSLHLREVAFTFDGGDDANVAEPVLEALRAHDVHTTMFLTGNFIRRHPDLVRRIVAAGHEVGNHLDSHPHLTTYAENRQHLTRAGLTRDVLVAELGRAAESFAALTGAGMAPYWRAPYGEHNAEIRGWAAEAGYRHISWTRGAGRAEDLDTRDWVADRSSHIYRSGDEIAERILAFGRGRAEGLNGGIVLMHLGSRRAEDRPHERLAALLAALQGQGYRLVPISTLLAHAERIRYVARRPAGDSQAEEGRP